MAQKGHNRCTRKCPGPSLGPNTRQGPGPLAAASQRLTYRAAGTGYHILKAEATFRFAKALRHFGIQTFADVLKSGLRNDLRQAIKAIPGQSNGLSYAYFLILAGNQDGVKADRMVTRFVANALGVRNVAPELAEELDLEVPTC
jgi:hypothetical protein